MSTAPPLPAAPPAAPEKNEITIVSHSFLFYWWPVWIVGLILAALTYVDSYRMAIVPKKTEAIRDAKVIYHKDGVESMVHGEILLLPPNSLDLKDPSDSNSAPVEPKNYLHVAKHANYGVTFTTVLVLVIIITNVPLRGMWSVMVIMLGIFLVIIFYLAKLWGPILELLGFLDIRINAGGYLFISLSLLLVWVITVVFFDRQIYIVFTPGQFKVCTEIGGGEKVFDTMGMKMEKQRSNLFLHWVLGLGSGDLIVRTAGAAAEHFDLQNVLFISHKVKMIEEMLQKRKVTETR